jgi:hypothetical protein
MDVPAFGDGIEAQSWKSYRFSVLRTRCKA